MCSVYVYSSSQADSNAVYLIDFCRYASRVKLITNDAQKNSENKEISRLKGVSIITVVIVAKVSL